MPVKWDDSRDKTLLLITLKLNPNMKFDYEEIVANWPNSNDCPTKRAVQDRLLNLRRGTGIVTSRPATGRRAPPNTPSRPLAAAVATSSTVKAEQDDNDPPASATSNGTSITSASKAKPKADAKVAAMVIKKEPGTEPTTPTPAAKNMISTISSGDKRKRTAIQSDGTMTDSSEEAVSTDDDTGMDSPTAASPKRRRVSSARASKIANGSLAHYDGGNSSDDNETGTGAGKAWAGIVKKRAKRAERDDSDSDWSPDFDASNDEGRKGRRGSAFRC